MKFSWVIHYTNNKQININRNLQRHIPRRGSSSNVSRSIWNLEGLFFVEGGKPENPEKTLGARREPTTNSTHLHEAGSGIRTQATMAGGERTNHAPNPAPSTYTSILSRITALGTSGDPMIHPGLTKSLSGGLVSRKLASLSGQWIAIYSLDSVVLLLNNWCQHALYYIQFWLSATVLWCPLFQERRVE